MSSRYKKDYMALQNAWNICVMRYLSVPSNSIERIDIIDDFRDSLIDIKNEGKQALRTEYENWENKVWLPTIQKELRQWTENNPFEANDQDNYNQQEIFLKRQHNYKRFRKIMQIIQDSGIGLGSGKERGHYELSGYMGETSE